MTKALSLFRDPWPELLPSDFFKDFDDFFKGLSGWRSQGWELRGFPRGDIYYDDQGRAVVELFLAGYAKEQLDISVEDGCLIITANKCEDESNAKRARQAFKKAVRFADDFDLDKIEASYENGLLTVVIPRQQQVKISKKIEIK